MIETIVTLLFYLLVAHALVDFSLQTDAMAKGKNRHNKKTEPPPGQKFIPCWGYWLSAHALQHGGCVAIVTDSITLGIAETITHWLIDFGKCEAWYNVHTDQILHFGCKLLWIFIIVSGI